MKDYFPVIIVAKVLCRKLHTEKFCAELFVISMYYHYSNYTQVHVFFRGRVQNM